MALQVLTVGMVHIMKGVFRVLERKRSSRSEREGGRHAKAYTALQSGGGGVAGWFAAHVGLGQRRLRRSLRGRECVDNET